MQPTRPLLFLQPHGVVMLGNEATRLVVMDALLSVSQRRTLVQDHVPLWQRLCDPQARTLLQQLHSEFNPQYCLSAPWTHLTDRKTAAQVLNACGLGFVSDALHTRWETLPRRGGTLANEVGDWLKLHGELAHPWAVLGPNASDSQGEVISSGFDAFCVQCFPDAGLTAMELEQMRPLLAQPKLQQLDSMRDSL